MNYAHPYERFLTALVGEFYENNKTYSLTSVSIGETLALELHCPKDIAGYRTFYGEVKVKIVSGNSVIMIFE